MRDMRGITLIALVITIIILLILAGVTINIIINGGLIGQAQNATDRYKQAEKEEFNSLNNIVEQMNNINTGGANTPIDPETAKPGDIIKTEEGIKYTSDGEGNEIPVPETFTYAGEGTKETGFVIKNDIDGNEFVWIPTNELTYQIYDWKIGLIDANNYKEYYIENEAQNAQIIQEITNSVNKHKGYYISRYEAGTTTKRTSRTETSQEQLPMPIFRATTAENPIYAYNYITWDDAIYLGNKLYNKAENKVTSRLINARGWDTALKFIEKIDKTYPVSST